MVWDATGGWSRRRRSTPRTSACRGVAPELMRGGDRELNARTAARGPRPGRSTSTCRPTRLGRDPRRRSLVTRRPRWSPPTRRPAAAASQTVDRCARWRERIVDACRRARQTLESGRPLLDRWIARGRASCNRSALRRTRRCPIRVWVRASAGPTGRAPGGAVRRTSSSSNAPRSIGARRASSSRRRLSAPQCTGSHSGGRRTSRTPSDSSHAQQVEASSARPAGAGGAGPDVSAVATSASTTGSGSTSGGHCAAPASRP